MMMSLREGVRSERLAGCFAERRGGARAVCGAPGSAFGLLLLSWRRMFSWFLTAWSVDWIALFLVCDRVRPLGALA